MEDLSGQVLLGFDIKARKITKEKSHYILSTNKGMRTIRAAGAASNESKEHILFQHAIKERMYENGFPDTDRFYLAADGLPYCEHDGAVYVMTDALNGRELDFSDENAVMGAVRALARMHKAAQGLRAPAGFTAREDYADELKRDIARLRLIKKRVNAQRRLYDFDVLFLRNFEFYTGQLELCLSELNPESLRAAEARAAELGMICHNAVKEKNMLTPPDKTPDRTKIHIINFSEAHARHVCADISAFVQRYGKACPARRVSANKLLDAYTDINPLTQAEASILKPLIRRPNRFLKACEQYYDKKRTWTPGVISARIEETVRDKCGYAAYVDEFKV